MNTFLPFPASAFARACKLARATSVTALVLLCGSRASAGDSPSDTLSEADILTTVRMHQSSVRQRCWEPRKATIGTTSVRTAIRINPDGTVDKVDASGDSEAMVNCVSAQVRTWHFPESKKPSTISVPFKFVIQR